jgi:exosortase A
MIDDSSILKSPLALGSSTVAAGAARAIALIAVVLGTFAVLWPTTISLSERWADTVSRAYTHGSLILLLSCVLVWRRRAVLAAIPAQPSWLACAATAALGLAWLIAFRAGITIGHQILLPIICLGVVATIFGFAVLRRLWLPIGYLYFAIPIWDILNPLLQWGAAFAVRGLLSVVGIPVFFDGLEFQIPAGRFEIADGCSGLHFFLVGLSIATLYGEMHSDSRVMRLKLLALATFFALATNWVRIALIIVVGHQTDMQHHLVKEEHYTFGWFMFAGAMAIYFLIVRRWPAPPESADPVALPAVTPAVPVRGVWLACAALALPAVAPLADANVAGADRASRYGLPQVQGWSRDASAINGAPLFRNPDSSEQATFVRDLTGVQAFSAVYLQQTQGKELNDFANRPFGEGFAQVSGFTYPGDGRWLEVQVRDRARATWLVRVLYRVDDAAFANSRHAQLAYAARSLSGDPVSSALVLRTACATDCDAARTALDRFTRDAGLTPGATP